MLGRLAERVDFPSELQNFLEGFIEKRNILAHRLHSVPGVHVGTKSGREAASKFLFDVTQDAFKALYIFGIMLHSLLGERGFAEPLEGIDVSIYKYIQKTHPEVITMLPSEMGIPPEIL